MTGKEADRIVVAAIVIWAVGLLIGFAVGYMVGRGNGKMEAYEAIERELAIGRQGHHGAR